MEERFVADVTGLPSRGVGEVMLANTTLACHQGVIADDAAATAGEPTGNLAHVDEPVRLIETED